MLHFHTTTQHNITQHLCVLLAAARRAASLQPPESPAPLLSSPSHPEHVSLVDRYRLGREERESQQRMQHQGDLTREQLDESSRQRMDMQQEEQRIAPRLQECATLDPRAGRFNSSQQIQQHGNE